MKVVPQNNWESYGYRTDSGPVVVGFHADADKIEQAAFPHCARVIITLKRPDHNGAPTREEAEVLWAMEDRLIEILEAHSVVCLLLGRLTHSGCRELVFQVGDWETFRPPVGRWILKHGDYETEVSEHEGWEFFLQSVWPSPQSWMLIYDRRVVDQLVEHGSDPAKPHSLEFVFRGSRSGLERMQTLLLDREYVVIEFKANEELLVMAKSMKLDLDAICTESLLHAANAEKVGIEYDGWGCKSVS